MKYIQAVNSRSCIMLIRTDIQSTPKLGRYDNKLMTFKFQISPSYEPKCVLIVNLMCSVVYWFLMIENVLFSPIHKFFFIVSNWFLDLIHRMLCEILNYFLLSKLRT